MRVLIADQTGAHLSVELNAETRRGYNALVGTDEDRGWHVLSFEDGRVYEPHPALMPEHAMAGEFATHDFGDDPPRPHVASGLCSCRPEFEATPDGAGRWVHRNKRVEATAAVEPGPEPEQDGPGGPKDEAGDDDATDTGGEA